jgi:hypothetical protein
MTLHVRTAMAVDVPRQREIIEASVRGLQAEACTPAQIEGALKRVYGVDSQLIADGTCFALENLPTGSREIAACAAERLFLRNRFKFGPVGPIPQQRAQIGARLE